VAGFCERSNGPPGYVKAFWASISFSRCQIHGVS
jgi:hypothetical protein